MRAIGLVIEPFKFIVLKEVKIVKEINQHGMLLVKGIISEDEVEQFFKSQFEECSICVKCFTEDNEEIVMFQGIIVSISLQTEGQVYQLLIEAKTGSYLLDRIPHIRLFQETSQTYEAVMQGIVQSAGGNINMVLHENEEINEFLVQYKETDWEFCRRLSNNLGLVLLPEFQQSGKFFHIGIGNQMGRTLVSERYAIEHVQYRSDEQRLIWGERGIYKVCSREIYNLGEYVVFADKRLLVIKVESYLEGQELNNLYHLCLLKTSADVIRFNDKVQGIALSGKVEKVASTKVQVSINEDENQTKGGRWFDYATVYSTPDGTGWYCMPEVGDAIRLVFPDEDETKAYVASSVHLAGSDGRDNPDQKFWKNKWGKEVRFTPDSLLLTNNAGLSVNLNDSSGISLSSDKNIYLTGNKAIHIRSEGVSISGNSGVLVTQNMASIKMDDGIDLSGGKINMN